MNIATRKKTLQLLSNGVYILTSRNDNRYGAATVTWLSQISFKPPLIMAAVRTGSNVFQCMQESRVATIHILGSDQKEIAQKFFSPTKSKGSLINGEPFVAGKTSSPILQNVPVYVECRVKQIVDSGGDHAVVIMEVVEAQCREQVRPLTIAESPWDYGG